MPIARTVTKEEHHAERLRREAIFNQIMEELELDAICAHSNGAMAFQAPVKFMTDLATPCGRIFAWMYRGCQPEVIVARPDTAFHCSYKTFLDPDHVEIFPDMVGELCRRINALPGKPRIGIPNFFDWPKGAADLLLTTKGELVDITSEFVTAKAPKAPYELKLIRETCDLAVRSFEEVVKMIRPGLTSKDIIGFAEGYLRANGAEATLILTREEKPYAFINRPNWKILGPDDIFVYSCEIAGDGGYWTQIIRPIFLSRKSDADAYDLLCKVKEAIRAGAEKFRPGNDLAEVSVEVSRIAKKYNLREGIWAGHGMGIDLGDGINLGANEHMEIKPDMIITLHPSLLDGEDGILYADTFQSTESDPINLTDKYTDSPYLEDLRELIH